MSDLRKAAEMALERLESHEYWMDEEAIQALRQALAQPEQESVLAGSLSVRYFRGDKAMTDTYFEYLGDLSEGDYTLYTAPPKREWVGLTQEEVDALLWKLSLGAVDEDIRTIEAKLKEKNNVL